MSDIDYNVDLTARARLREAQATRKDSSKAAGVLSWITHNHIEPIGPEVAIGLAMHLAHLAGGDGRGVFVVMHDPEGDRI